MRNLCLSEQNLIRIKKLKTLKQININPYPSEEYTITYNSKEIRNNYKKKQKVILAGRIIRIRRMGKASFIELKDKYGIIQIYISINNFNYEKKIYNLFFKKLLDIGDIIGIKGYLFKTKKKQISVFAKKIKLLSKCLHTLPNVKIDKSGNTFDSFSKNEKRHRIKYVDFLVNEEIKHVILTRIQIITFIRNYLNERNYLEVETPILQAIPGGAIARPFITYHNTLKSTFYLRISNELYLKKLLVGGLEQVYEFSRNFRNEGIDKKHNPEFTILELYISYKDYYWMMKFTEKFLNKICCNIYQCFTFKVGKQDINFLSPFIDPFQQITFFEALKIYTGFDLSDTREPEIIKICAEINVKIDNNMKKGQILDQIFSQKCEKKILKPTFIIDFPIEMSPLAKKHRFKNGVSERFELIINGVEIANSYSELNDPIDQFKRFKQQIKLYNKIEAENMLIDKDFLLSLEYGMPPCTGIGFGIDRLIMLFTNQRNINDVLFFPTIKIL
ncbi:lysine--tRNA ligase [Candidatus Karelsulcia muelleri]|uniref:Lysine--tRNA ligase n=1 Tax=Candidatus Karelsulcia muelleri TaxID=336810 RepID=A0A346E0Y3_9FLAO|nr:lysine--tRNA ligase [Candidatus Karelsulcia muelleri]AXN02638.1 Lysyl-tRNA synthetase (class II) [Candidatus Karelsulcia muelleri]WDI79575.1 lysine--tRNA ligase [Candidatus Karelsulcia muelleri]WDR78896.1 lysine--tRNA ligase [Candidatus Karelsulcia muelleri]